MDRASIFKLSRFHPSLSMVTVSVCRFSNVPCLPRQSGGEQTFAIRLLAIPLKPGARTIQLIIFGLSRAITTIRMIAMEASLTSPTVL